MGLTGAEGPHASTPAPGPQGFGVASRPQPGSDPAPAQQQRPEPELGVQLGVDDEVAGGMGPLGKPLDLFKAIFEDDDDDGGGDEGVAPAPAPVAVRGPAPEPRQGDGDTAMVLDGEGGVRLYAHGTVPEGDLAGHGDDLFVMRLAAGRDAWGRWTRIAKGSLDCSVAVRWAQFHEPWPGLLDWAFWNDAYPNDLWVGTDTP